MTSSLVLLTTQATTLDDPLPCRRESPQLWFSDLPADLQLAKAYCRPCPIPPGLPGRAVERHEPHGVWGGEIFTSGAIIAEKSSAAGRARSRAPGPGPRPAPGSGPVRRGPAQMLGWVVGGHGAGYREGIHARMDRGEDGRNRWQAGQQRLNRPGRPRRRRPPPGGTCCWPPSCTCPARDPGWCCAAAEALGRGAQPGTGAGVRSGWVRQDSAAGRLGPARPAARGMAVAR